MKSYERIVVAVDAERCEPVVRRAADVARASGGELLVASVARPVRPDRDWVVAPSYVEMLDELEQEVLDRRRSLVEACCRGCGVSPSEILVELGKPAQTILGLAETLQPDLLVIGAKDSAGHSTWSMGSTCYKVLHHSPVDVFVVA